MGCVLSLNPGHVKGDQPSALGILKWGQGESRHFNCLESPQAWLPADANTVHWALSVFSEGPSLTCYRKEGVGQASWADPGEV